MRELGNKLLLFIICSYMFRFMELNTVVIMAFALSIAITGLCTYFADGKPTAILLIFYAVLTLIEPIFGVYLPLLLYDSLYYRQTKGLIATAIVAVSVLFRLPHTLFIPLLALFTVSVLLALYSLRINQLLIKLHEFRDRSTEAEINLKQRNQALIEKQNYEIYLATLSERNRIAKEIHDNVGHMLTRSILQTGALKVLNKDPILDEPLSTLSDTLNTAMTNIRESVHDLHDESIDLKMALTDIVKEVTHPAIKLEYDARENIPREIKYAFISIIKEAINNIVKHSNADSAHIILREHPAFYRLQIRDNGTSADLSSLHKKKGIGLSNMKERVVALNGNIEFDTTDGFCINISILKKDIE